VATLRGEGKGGTCFKKQFSCLVQTFTLAPTFTLALLLHCSRRRSILHTSINFNIMSSANGLSRFIQPILLILTPK
jgi:hypothetical protein